MLLNYGTAGIQPFQMPLLTSALSQLDILQFRSLLDSLKLDILSLH